MDPTDLRDRITDQFSYRGDRSDIWRGFDLLLDTDAFLNLGYSRWYQPHFVGSSQRRLATKIGRHLEAELQTTEGVPLLDVGSGRGGPAVTLDTQFGFHVTGLDLVPYNVQQATANAQKRDADVRFVVGDVTALPFDAESMTACTAIDSLVYVPDRSAAISGMSDVLRRDGVVVCSDLVMDAGISRSDRQTVTEFADAWDMPPLGTIEEYRQLFVDAGLKLGTVEDITQHSVGRFRKWTSLFLKLFASPARPVITRLLQRYGIDPATIRTQIRLAHEALPHLRHAIFVARK